MVPKVHVAFRGLRLEGRYNYEDLHTGSMFLGWHVAAGSEDLGLDVVPMVGWAFGRTDGFAPALLLDVGLRPFQLYGEVEYVFEESGSGFLYDRADFIYNMTPELFVGVVGEHTVVSSDHEFTPGILMGTSGSRVEVAFYLFGPGRKDARGGLELVLEW
jgi:hypothetical protein